MSEEQFEPAAADRSEQYEGRGRIGRGRQAIGEVDYAFDVIHLPGTTPGLMGELWLVTGDPDLLIPGQRLRLQLEDGRHVAVIIVALETSFDEDGPISFEIRAAPEQAGQNNILR